MGNDIEIGAALYEGKAKIIYATSNPLEYVMRYKDSATALNGEKKEEIYGKGRLNRRISGVIFEALNKAGVPTHFVRDLDETSVLVRKAEIIPLETIVRNVAAGSFSKRFGVAEGTPLRFPTLEFCLKNDALGDPMINDYHIAELGLAGEDELRAVSGLAFRINDLLSALFARAGLRLIDFKLEFGRGEGGVMLADEISPDTCRLWDAETGEKLDKDLFRRSLGGLIPAYEEVLRRITE
jgi:phosphoribosylaminoimidazole-succinocarboxamide synthase